LCTYKETYCQGIGIIRGDNEFDFGNSTDVLKDFVINGAVYGDTTITGITEATNKTLNKFNLSQNYLNPFSPATTIKYSIPSFSTSSPLAKGTTEEGFVTLKIYNILEREVSTLVNQKQAPGNYQVAFKAGNLPSGMCLHTLSMGKYSVTKKMLLLK